MADPVLTFTDRGIYCPAGDFHIDPWRPVDRALITHGHSDHARWGHRRYLATHQALPVIRHRLGQIDAQGIGYGEALRIGGVKMSIDGGITGRNACFYEPYEDDEHNHGDQNSNRCRITPTVVHERLLVQEERQG